jgi:hypothetical protein
MDTEVTLQKDALTRESTLCVAGILDHWMTLSDPKFISLTTIQVGKSIKDIKERVFWIRELQTLHPEGINKKA